MPNFAVSVSGTSVNYASLVSVESKSNYKSLDSRRSVEKKAENDYFFPPLIVWPAAWHLIFVSVIITLLAMSVTLWKDWILDNLKLSSRQILEYASIPFVSVVFTYWHIWIALWLTFYPTYYFGYLQIKGTNTGCGWQGIVPSKAEKMARTSVQLMVGKLISIQEVFDRLDPTKIAQYIVPSLEKQLSPLLDQTATTYSPLLWAQMPQFLKDDVLSKAMEDAPLIIVAVMSDVKRDIEKLLNLEEMVVKILLEDVEMLNEIFIRCGFDELCFIRNFGMKMGFFFGIVQMILWYFYPLSWLLPAFGLVVGSGTNWLALQMIFRPVNPINCGCCTLQGLFLKRQNEVAKEYGRMVGKKIINSKNIIAEIVSGPTAEKIVPILKTHIDKAIDNFAGVPRPIVNMTVGGHEYDQAKEMILNGILENMEPTLNLAAAYSEEAFDIENTIGEKMAALPPGEFEALLHPVFQEDEWKLVLLGGVLGVVIGFAQVFILGE